MSRYLEMIEKELDDFEFEFELDLFGIERIKKWWNDRIRKIRFFKRG